jgi:hypothetical protein
MKHWSHKEEVMQEKGRETKNLNRVDILGIRRMNIEILN